MSTVGKGSQFYSGFSPTSIPGCDLWLDSGDRSTFTLSGSTVTQWRDKSGNGRHGTAVGSPTLGTTTTGRQTINFGGTAHFTITSNMSTFARGSMTWFMMASSSTTVGRNIMHLFGNERAMSFQLYYNATVGANLFFSPQYPWQNANSVVCIVENVGVGCTGFVNGTGGGGMSQGSAAFAGTPSQILVGTNDGTNSWIGNIQETIIYNTALSTVERQQVEGYLAAKWGIAARLPTTHPYYWGQFVSSPTSISGCMLWLDAADATSVTLSTGSNVSSWRDKSGRGCNTTSSTGTVTFPANSNGLFFDGGSSLFLPNDTLPIGNTSYSYFFIFTSTDSSLQVRNILTAGTTANGQMFAIRNAGTGSGRVNTYWFNFDLATTNAFTSNQRSFVSTFYQSGGQRSVWVNFVQGAVDTPGTRSQTNVNNRIGHGPYDNPWLGLIHEIIVYSNALPAFERQQIEGYLAAKWGLAASLPASHPHLRVIPKSLSLRPFSPLDISECVMWFDAADASTFTFSSGSNISVWSNKSSRTDSIATWDSVAVLVSPGTLGNGVPNVRFSNYAYTSNALGYGGATGETIFMVGNNSSTTQYLGVTRWSNNAWNGSHVVNLRSDAVRPEIQGVGGINITGLPARTKLAVGVVTATTLNAFESGTAGATNPVTIALNQANANIRWGSGGGIPNDVGELLYYNKALTTEERQRVEGYLAAKWGLRGNIPSTHPFKLANALSVPFNPAQIPGCQLWLDAADTNTITLSGSTLTGWTDKSGTSRTITVNTAPTYSATSFGGLPGLTFSGSSRLSSTLSSGLGQNMTLAVVCIVTSSSGNNMPLSVGTNTTDSGITWRNDLLRFVVFDYGFGESQNSTITTINSRAAVVGVKSASSPNLISVVNGSAAPTANSTYSNASTQVNIGNGGSFGFTGVISEILIISTALTVDRRQQLEGYLTWKWGLRTSIPATHPYSKFNPS